MAEARGREAWARTSAVMALLANLHRDPRKGRSFKPSDFDPFARHPQPHQRLPKSALSLLKDVFVRNPPGKEQSP